MHSNYLENNTVSDPSYNKDQDTNTPDVDNSTSDMHDSQMASLNRPNISNSGKKSLRIDPCADVDMVLAIRSAKEQFTHENGILLRKSTRQQVGCCSIMVPATPTRPKKGKSSMHQTFKTEMALQVEPTEPAIKKASGAMMETSFNSISPTGAEHSMNPVAEKRQSSRKRKAPVRLADCATPKIKKERVETPIKIEETEEDTIAVARPDAILISLSPISQLQSETKKQDDGSDLRLINGGLKTLGTIRNNANYTEDSVVLASPLVEGSSKSNVGSLGKKSDGRKNPEVVRKRLDTMRRNLAKKQRRLLHAAGLQAQSKTALERHSKLDSRRRGRSAPPGQRILQAKRITEPNEYGCIPLETIKRALSESPRTLVEKLHRGTERSRQSLPPSTHRNERRIPIEERGEEIPISPLTGHNHQGRRAYSEGAMPDPQFPTFEPIQGSTLKNPPVPTRNRKKIKKIRVGGLRLPKDTPPPLKLKRKRATAATSQKKNRTSLEGIGPSDADINLSDALDISDADTTCDENGFPFQLSEKLARAEKRPRLQLYHFMNPHPTKTTLNQRRGTRKGKVKIEEGAIEHVSHIEDERQEIRYDLRYHPSALSYDSVQEKWQIPHSCERYVSSISPKIGQC